MKRRSFIKKSSSAGLLAMSLPAIPDFSSIVAEMRFGVAEASYVQRRYAKLDSINYPPFTDSLQMIEHCSSVGFGGVQFSVSGWDAAFAKKVKKRVKELDLFLEGQIRLPKDDSDLQRFISEVSAAREAGVDIIRTACLSGRRYETFDSKTSFQEFRTRSINSLKLAEPIVRDFNIKLAVENHKDWRITEMIEILDLIDSDWVGVTLDTGNNLSLLEDPMEVVESLAPYAFTVHLKDMAVEEYEDGAVIKPSAATPELMTHRGRAVVFENIEDCHANIDRPDLEIDENSVIVLKGAGPVGYPGMPEVGNVELPEKLLKKGIKDMVRISDGRMSGTAFGTVILHVSPESSIGGVLGLVQTGDYIALDVPNRKLHLEVEQAELEKRKSAWTPPQQASDRGYTNLYTRTVQQAHLGADLDFLVGKSSSVVTRDAH